MWPGDRDISIVFQNLALYPDKTVFNNLAFPLKQRKVPKDEIRQRVDAVSRTLHIEHLLDRKPGKLSGGERQRVALGRAIVREPQAYLFDEPISALYALLRLEMRAELKRLQRDLGRTLVYVTHDQVEAMSMADRILVLREGVVQQIATPEEIYHQPVNQFVATVVGSPPMNFLHASAMWSGDSLRVEHPEFALEVSAGAAPGEARTTLPDGSPCIVGVRPEDVRIGLDDEGVPATVYVTEPLGGETVVDLLLADRLIKALAPETLRLQPDTSVRAVFDPTRLHVFTEDGQAVLSAAGTDLFDLQIGSPAGSS
jgi:multiple sugar transport system ATP-binding protein